MSNERQPKNTGEGARPEITPAEVVWALRLRYADLLIGKLANGGVFYNYELNRIEAALDRLDDGEAGLPKIVGLEPGSIDYIQGLIDQVQGSVDSYFQGKIPSAQTARAPRRSSRSKQ